MADKKESRKAVKTTVKKTTVKKTVKKPEGDIYHPKAANYINFYMAGATVSVWLHPQQVWTKIGESDDGNMVIFKRNEVNITMPVNDILQVFKKVEE